MTIRLMSVEDMLSVREVARVSWHDTYKGIIPESVQDSFIQRAYSDDTLIRRMKKSILIVDERDGMISGFANFSETNNQGKSELGAIYLLPNYQGQKIGSQLLEKGINLLDFPKQIVVHVEKENKKGLGFYEKQGFRTVDTFEEIFFGHKLKTIRMALILSGNAPF